MPVTGTLRSLLPPIIPISNQHPFHPRNQQLLGPRTHHRGWRVTCVFWPQNSPLLRNPCIGNRNASKMLNNFRKSHVTKYVEYRTSGLHTGSQTLRIFDDFLNFCFSCFLVDNLLSIVMAAFWCDAFPAFPPIKHEKRAKQSAVFLMRACGSSNQS